MATYVGQNRGAGKMDRVKAGMKYTQIMVLIWSVITMIIMFFFGKYMTWLFIDKSQTDVINNQVMYFPKKNIMIIAVSYTHLDVYKRQ